MPVDFREQDLDKGVVLGVGICKYAPVPLRPLSIPISIVEYLNKDQSEEDARVDGTRFGDPSSTMRVIGSCQWILGDSNKLCSFLGPPDFKPNEENQEDMRIFKNTIYMCDDSRINMHSLHDEYTFDPSDHIGTKGLFLSSSKDSINPSSPQNNRVLDLKEIDGEQKYAYNDKDAVGAGFVKERYTDTRLISHEDIIKHQRHSRSKFFTDCFAGDNHEVSEMVKDANYLVIGSSTLGIGLRRYEGGKLPGMGSDDCSDRAQVKGAEDNDVRGGEEGGLAALVPLLEQCITHNKAVIVTFTGATLVQNMRTDFMMLLQYTDFLFITERECRRAAILLFDDPNMNLRACTRALSTYTKISEKRPRVVVVLPNAPLPVYSKPSREITPERQREEREGLGFREKYDAEGRPAFNRFTELDSRCHDNDQELRSNVDPNLPIDGQPGFRTSLMSVSDILGPSSMPTFDVGGDLSELKNQHSDVSKLSPGTHYFAQDVGPEGSPLYNTSVLVMSLGEDLRVPVYWPEPDEATGMATSLVKNLHMQNEDRDGELSTFSDLFYADQEAQGAHSSPTSASFTSTHSFYYNQAGAAFLPRRPYRVDGSHISNEQPEATATAKSVKGVSIDAKSNEDMMSPAVSRHGQNQEEYRQAVIASQAAHTAQCDIFIGAFIALVVRSEAAINAAHQRLLSEQAAKSLVRETVPDLLTIESAAARSQRLQRERSRAGISDDEHRRRLRTAQFQQRSKKKADGNLGPAKKALEVDARAPHRASNRNEADSRLNRGDKRRGLTKTKRNSLFQGPESRMRNSDLTSMVEVDASKHSICNEDNGAEKHKVSVRAIGVSSWGDDDNAQNEYSGRGIKWEDAPLSAVSNIVTGKRLLYDCVAAGCYALANYQAPLHNMRGPKTPAASPLADPSRNLSPVADSKGRPDSPMFTSSELVGPGARNTPSSPPRSPGSRLGTARKPTFRPPCEFWRRDQVNLEAAIEAAAIMSLNGTSVVSETSTLRGQDEHTISLHENDYGASSVSSNFSDSSKSSHWSARRRLHQSL